MTASTHQRHSYRDVAALFTAADGWLTFSELKARAPWLGSGHMWAATGKGLLDRRELYVHDQRRSVLGAFALYEYRLA